MSDGPAPGGWKYCEECGQQLRSDANFCDRCGAKQTPSGDSRVSAQSRPQPQQTTGERTQSQPDPYQYDNRIGLPRPTGVTDFDSTIAIRHAFAYCIYFSVVSILLVGFSVVLLATGSPGGILGGLLGLLLWEFIVIFLLFREVSFQISKRLEQYDKRQQGRFYQYFKRQQGQSRGQNQQTQQQKQQGQQSD